MRVEVIAPCWPMSIFTLAYAKKLESSDIILRVNSTHKIYFYYISLCQVICMFMCLHEQLTTLNSAVPVGRKFLIISFILCMKELMNK